MVLERCFCSYKYVYVYYVEIIRYVTHTQKSIIHKVRYLFIRSMYTRPLGLPSRRLLFSSNENQSRIFKVASYCSTEHLVHVILACVRQNLLPLVFDRRHMVGALKWSRRTFLPCKHKEFPLQEQRTSPAPKTLFNSVMFKSEWILWTFVKSA